MFKKRTNHFAKRSQPRLVWLLVLFFGFFCTTTSLNVRAASPDAEWKASFIVHCANHFSWPSSRESEGRFIIGIIGSSEVRTLVANAISGKKLGNQTVHVIAAAATDVPNCHIVYIAGGKSSSVLGQTKGNAVVTIGELPDGYMVWFAPASDGSLTARGNRDQMQKEGLSCTAKLGKVLFTK